MRTLPSHYPQKQPPFYYLDDTGWHPVNPDGTLPDGRQVAHRTPDGRVTLTAGFFDQPGFIFDGAPIGDLLQITYDEDYDTTPTQEAAP